MDGNPQCIQSLVLGRVCAERSNNINGSTQRGVGGPMLPVVARDSLLRSKNVIQTTTAHLVCLPGCSLTPS